MTPAVLLGLGVLVALLPRRAVAIDRPRHDLGGGVAAVGAGALVWVLVGGTAGLALGALVAAATPLVLARLGDGGDDAEVAASLPLALELLAACLAGGASQEQAVRVVAQAFPGGLGARLTRVADALALGAAAEDAWAALGHGPGTPGAAARALARAAEGGAPVVGAVRRVAAEARRQQRAEALRRAARAGVLAVLPLGACFLPAFVLLGVVPAVIGLAGPVLHTLG